MQMIADVLAVFLCTMFVVSAVPKIINLPAFKELTVAYGVLPDPIAAAFGILLPFTELFGAALLLHGGTAIYGVLILLGLLLSFAYAVSTILRTKKTIDCGCYGKFFDAKADRFTLIKIGILTVAAFIVLIRATAHPVHLSLNTVLLGSFLTVGFLTAQAVWSYHTKAMDTLKNHH
ncbi:MAG: MauE/DoxX family redox-associated membrane protein [Planifilum sp.]|jgi:hypothetical protein